MNKFFRRLALGLPPILPAYLANLVMVYVLATFGHLTAFGVVTVVVIGDVTAYVINIALSDVFLVYFKRFKYFTKEDLER